jgi:hypothetical protein
LEQRNVIVYADRGLTNQQKDIPSEEPTKTVDQDMEVKEEPPADVEFPIVSQRSTRVISSLASNDKGVIMTVSPKYLSITRDYGKTWEDRSFPASKDFYRIQYCSGMFYLSKFYMDMEVTTYYSKDGKKWTPFILNASDGSQLIISDVKEINGNRILLAYKDRTNITYVFASADGMSWTRESEIPSPALKLFWSGKRYIAYGGYEYRDNGKKKLKNQFVVDPGRAAELIVYSSSDFKQWTMHSGAIKKDLAYTWVDSGRVKPNYFIDIENPSKPFTNGVISLYDLYTNQLISSDGITYTLKKNQKILYSNYGRSPIFEKNKQYYVFQYYWTSGGIRTKVLTSKDKINWKETKINTINSIVVIQSGQQFIGYNSTGVVISEDGFKWKQIR